MNIYESCLRQDFNLAWEFLKKGEFEKAKYWLLNIRENRIKYRYYNCV